MNLLTSSDPPRAGASPPGLDDAIVQTIGPFVSPLAFKNISTACNASSMAYTTGILRQKWATQMFDATGKLPDGILSGNLHPWGNWGECLDTVGYYNITDSETAGFIGRYCLAFIDENSSSGLGDNLPAQSSALSGLLPATVGICIPSTCSSQELAEGLTTVLRGKVKVMVPETTCYTREDDRTLSSGAVVVVVMFGVVATMMLVGTVVDVLADYANDCSPGSAWVRVNTGCTRVLPRDLRRLLLAFSVYRNGRKLLNTTSSGEILGCLHGIRFLSNTWVILGHSYYFMSWFKHQNPTIAFTWMDSVAFAAIENATLSVDSFFMLSGLLVAYITLRGLERARGQFSWIMFYVHRYVRLTPVMMSVVAFVATLYVYLGSGPWWGKVAEGLPKHCVENWWTNMLYINNFVNMETSCIGQTWYLANDMQMYIFSPLVLLPLYHRPALAQLWLIFLLCFFTGMNAMTTAMDDIGPTGGQFGGPNFDMRYKKPWCRAGPYLVGLYLGWILHKIKGKKIRIPPQIVAIGWLAAFTTGCLVVYGLYDYTKFTHRTAPHETVSIVYGMLSRTAWSVALAWLVFACVTGHGGPINTFLSWKAFIPLSRLTYTSYLTSNAILQYYWATNKAPVMLDQTTVVYMFLGSLPIIFAVSALFSLAFESPMLAIEKMIVPAPPQSLPKTATPSDNDKSAPREAISVKEDELVKGKAGLAEDENGAASAALPQGGVILLQCSAVDPELADDSHDPGLKTTETREV